MQLKNTNLSDHPLQSAEWGIFRKKTGIKSIIIPAKETGFNDDLLITFHKIPYSSFYIGYLAKSRIPDKKTLSVLKEIGRKEKCIFIQIEPNTIMDDHSKKIIDQIDVIPSAHPLFTKYTFMLDLTKSEEELLMNMHSKTRYNIKVARRHNILVKEDNNNYIFDIYLKLLQETTKRQHFYAHDFSYHKKMWEILRCKKINQKSIDKITKSDYDPEKLTAHLLTAEYNRKILTTWVLFTYKDALYYPYGASSSENREAMSSTLMMWEAIRFGKNLGLKYFDMWGALSKNPDPKDSWYGFHRFKSGFGPEHIEFVGSYDLIINSSAYKIYKIADKIRSLYLALKPI